MAVRAPETPAVSRTHRRRPAASAPTGDWGRYPLIAAALVLAAFFVMYGSGWGGDTLRTVLTDGAYVPVSAVATVLAVRNARGALLDRRTRQAWSLLAIAFGCQLWANIAWFWLEGVRHESPFPSVADIGYLAFIPVLLAGVLRLPAGRGVRRDRMVLGLDLVTVVTGSFMVIWYLVLGPVIMATGAGALISTVSIAYPVGDLVLIFAMGALWLRRGVMRNSHRSLQLLVAAVLLFVVADVYYGYVSLHAGFVGGSWPDLCWLTANFLMALSAYVQHRDAARPHRETPASGLAGNRLPYLAVAVGYGLLMFLAHREQLYPLGGTILGAVALTALVVARQMKALHDNRQIATTDPLTGLANRALLHERLRVAVERAGRRGGNVAVLAIDLDRFKPINDAYGHETGDGVLLAVSQVLRAAIRAGDTAARLGGDEFAVVMEAVTDPSVAQRIADRILSTLDTPVVIGPHVVSVQASIGIAIGGDGTTGEELLRHADAAMYRAKQGGSARAVTYTDELTAEVREDELRAAIDGDQLVLQYQPIVDIATGEATGVEALVRWHHPTRGLLGPVRFIPLAEHTGLIVPLGRWVLREACRQAGLWLAGPPGLTLHVNLSPRQAQHPDLVADVTEILRDSGIDPRRLVLELTEGILVQHDERTLAKLAALRDLGLRIAIDDFGTGYSSLSYLQKLPIDIIKIDRSFVAGLTDGGRGYAIGAAVVQLGQALDLTLVAEGIETADQASALRGLGCRQGQGFHYARPQDPTVLDERFASMAPPAA